ncbi:MAG TPA: hypothetical protein VN633_01495 [Bryobacteraceae bacterium]|nr:hypothetical protein [Bryobacteraceae bacterium]
MTFQGREAVQIENNNLRVTVLREGGHIAEILHKQSGVSPLWIPPWPSIEPSSYDAANHPEYGRNEESLLLSGIMGHNLCLDTFGPPSREEAAAGLSVHGEGSVARYEIDGGNDELIARVKLSSANLSFARRIKLDADGESVHVSETVENVGATDRPIAWTQHVTLGPPFLEGGVTQFAASATKSRTFEREGFDAGGLERGIDYIWPHAPLRDGGVVDQRVFTDAAVSGKFTTHLMDNEKPMASFAAYHPGLKLLLRYRWRRADFPWLGIWEEKCSRRGAPWNGNTVALGMEFGVSPMPETRREMIDRGRLFGTPVYRWLPARSKHSVEYTAVLRRADGMGD